MTRDEFIAEFGDPEQFIKDDENFGRSMQFVSEHWDELYERYEGRWIAVYDGECITHGAEQSEVLAQLEGDPREPLTLVQYLMPRDVIVMMPWG